MARPPETLRADPFFPSFIAGRRERAVRARLRAAAPGRPRARRRARDATAGSRDEGRVDGVFLTDLHVDDPRPALLAELGLPAVIVGPGPAGGRSGPRSASTTAPGSPRPWSTSSGSATPGSRTSPARPRWCTAGPAATAWAARAARRPGLPEGPCVEADFSAEGGAAATRQLLDLAEPPTAIVYANDLMAIAGLAVAAARGVDVPGELSVTGFDDTELAAHLQPGADHRQHRRHRLGPGRGDAAARADRPAPRHRRPSSPPPRLVVRGSTRPRLPVTDP